MDVIDLTAARAQRAEEAARAAESAARTKAAVDSLYGLASDVAKCYADLAFSVSRPLFETCHRFAVDINRSQCRRAKVSMRGALRKTALDAASVSILVKYVEDTFWDAMNHLWWDYLRSIGRDPSAEATAELSAEMKPWPSCFVLSPEATVSWIDLIGRTGSQIKPATRTTLIKARADLEAGKLIESDTEALIDRLIRARWRQGHTMPWVNKFAAATAESA